ncbi:hypothetical protein ABTK52_18715, partial [Acinetobacter baumannii]
VFKLPDASTESGWLRQRFEDTRPVSGGRLDDIYDFFTAPGQFIENTMVRSAWRAFHMEALNKGMDAADALAYADKMAGRVVPSHNRGEG